MQIGIATLPDWEPPKSGAFALNLHCVAVHAYSAACITRTVQQEIEKILLLAIADIEKVKKYYSNDWIFLILN
ncbi:MAG: hypothetical protein V7K21_26890 [Nostoc sp.]|uniref:hypothetical protein n=1 Tax=Nostoc sp. TaxID=1180 RepID=UPI002FF6D192